MLFQDNPHLVELISQLAFPVSINDSGLINVDYSLVFHRILDLKRDWIFILVPFFFTYRQIKSKTTSLA